MTANWLTALPAYTGAKHSRTESFCSEEHYVLNWSGVKCNNTTTLHKIHLLKHLSWVLFVTERTMRLNLPARSPCVYFINLKKSGTSNDQVVEQLLHGTKNSVQRLRQMRRDRICPKLSVLFTFFLNSKR